jgi:signal transduction histidine kinase
MHGMRRRLWIGLGVLAVACSVVVTVAGLIDGYVAAVALGPGGIVPAALGLRILQLDRDNVVGSRLILLGTATAWMAIGDIGTHLGRQSPGSATTRWFALIDTNAFACVFAALVAVIIVFPDGHLPSARWRRFWPAFCWTFAGWFVLSQFVTERRAGAASIPSPLPRAPAPLVPFSYLGVLALFGVLLASFVSVHARFRRSTGIERLQMKWLAYTAGLIPGALALCFLDQALFGKVTALTGLALLAAVVALPVAIAIAVLRYHLYEIDRLINRTLVYVSLTMFLGAVYASIALGIGVVAGGGAVWATAVGTLAVAVAVRPARDRVQRAVDRRFAARRYHGLRRVEQFIADVRAGHEEPEQIGRVLRDALGDNGLEVYFYLPASRCHADATGRLTEPPVGDQTRMRTPVFRSELELGVVLHDPLLAQSPDTLDSILRAAGLAMEIARLRVEVRVQLAEIEASHARIVSAAEAERRKLERDLHDGAQQRLVALGLALRHAQHQLADDRSPDAAIVTLDGAVAQVGDAVRELREIARGLRPALLDAGLGPALSLLADRSPMPVTVEVLAETLPPDVEATTFYLACEALTNAVKHSGARHVRVNVSRRDGELRLEVADDGVGGAAVRAGGGLEGMAERAGGRGGTLTVESPAGCGTRVVIDLPVPR